MCNTWSKHVRTSNFTYLETTRNNVKMRHVLAVNTISVVTTPHIFYSSEDFNHFQPTFQKLLSFNLIIIHLSWELQGFFRNHPIDLSLPQRIPPYKYVYMYIYIYLYTLSYNHRDLVGLERGNKNITFAPPGCFVGNKFFQLGSSPKAGFEQSVKTSVTPIFCTCY